VKYYSLIGIQSPARLIAQERTCSTVLPDFSMIHADEVKQRIERFPAMCRRAGLKVTPQRQAVYAMLAATDTHPTPDAIFSAVRRELPSVSLATVYKVLDQLAAHGLLVKVSTPDQAARYDARTESHQHAACARCGRITDLHAEHLEEALARLPIPKGFQVRRVDVLVHGICAQCA
jgi:Fur family peroxide stress response transcriptional regulator